MRYAVLALSLITEFLAILTQKTLELHIREVREVARTLTDISLRIVRLASDDLSSNDADVVVDEDLISNLEVAKRSLLQLTEREIS